jgi:hypothetical protein
MARLFKVDDRSVVYTAIEGRYRQLVANQGYVFDAAHKLLL